MNRNQYFIDANIFMYTVGAEHELKEPSVQIFRDCVENAFFTYTNTEVLQEILHRYGRIGERLRAVRLTMHMAKLVTRVMPISDEDVSYALQLYQQHAQLTARDAIHAATVLNYKMTYMVSADQHFENIPGLARLDPKDWATHMDSLPISHR